MTDPLPHVHRLVRRANLRVRLQRALDAACAALMPALVLGAMAILLTKQGVTSDTELTGLLGALGLLVGAVTGAAALWPIDTLATLVELDASNALSDRLSSAWAFAQLPPAERTPEMALHLERTQQVLDRVEPARAHRFRRPPEVVPAALLAAVVAFVAVLAEPDFPPLPPGAAAAAVTPRYILDLAALRPEIRQIERLAELADESGDPAVQALADELESLLDRAEAGVLTEEELFDELARLEEAIARLESEPPADLHDEWVEVAETLREVLADAALPEALAGDVETFLEALEEGDEAALADAMDTLRDLLENEELDPEDLAALADALSDLADAFDPADLGLLEEMDALRDQLAALEEEMEGGGGRRTQRARDEAREALAEAEEALAQSREGMGEGGELRDELAEALRDAAEALSEPEPGEAPEGEPEPGESELAEAEPSDTEGQHGPETPGESESPDGEERADERGTETAEERRDEEGPRGEPGEGADSERDPTAETGRDGAPEPGEPGEPGEQGDGEPRPDQPAGDREQASNQPAEGQRGDRDQSQPPSAQERAAEHLDRAAEQLRERQREEARSEARERGQQATEGIRENLQRNDAEPREGEPPAGELAEQSWDEFMDRAEGIPPSPGQPQDGPPTEPEGEGDPAEQGGEAQASGGDPEGAEGDTTGELGDEGVGDTPGGDALGEEATRLDSDRDRVDAEVEVTDEGEAGPPTTGEVLESAAVEGFASRGYQEVYQQYAEAVEEALRSESIPPGYARFIERYFGLIEPRR